MGHIEAYPLRALRPREPMMTSVGLSPSIYTMVSFMKRKLLGQMNNVQLR